jgi:hypothetical protein
LFCFWLSVAEIALGVVTTSQGSALNVASKSLKGNCYSDQQEEAITAKLRLQDTVTQVFNNDTPGCSNLFPPIYFLSNLAGGYATV